MRPFLLLAAVVACTGAAGDDRPATDDTATPSDATGVRFAARVGDDEARCGVETTLGSSGRTVSLSDLRFFVHGLTLLGDDGEAALTLTPGPFQSATHALLDFEDGSGACVSGDARTNDLVEAPIPSGTWNSLEFVVGVAFADNHVPPAGVGAPFDAPGLARNRRDGFSFLRADVEVVPVPSTIWPLLVGSAGCDAELATDPPSACARPGRARVRLPYDPAEEPVVVFDVGALLGGIDLAADRGGPLGCTGDVADTFECGPMYDALGMSSVSGTCVSDCEGQRVFSVE